MATIELTQGMQAIVDDADVARLSGCTWWALKESGGLIYAGTRLPESGRAIVRLHRYLVGLPFGDSREVDHINGDGLDNRRVNLRICSRLENSRNRRKPANTSSRYLGVCWHVCAKRWTARIQPSVNGKKKYTHLGYFDNEVDAALAYNTAATRLYGEFARLNEVPNGQLHPISN
jgi:hypothetical protein